MALEAENERIIWDDRWWTLSQKAEKPMEVYKEISQERGDAPPNVEDLPAERQAWYKAQRDET